MRQTAGTLLVLLVIGATLTLSGSANAACPDNCEIYWDPVTMYTDNTAIEAADLPLSYVAEWDGVSLPATTQTSVAVPKPYGHGASHAARLKTVTARGKESAFSPPFSWASPEGVPRYPVGGGVR